VSLDAFSQRRLKESGIGQRWNGAKREHLVATLDMWLGMMLTRFTPDELELLERAGYLCPNDVDLLTRHRTVVHPHPSEARSV
jgi:hypothetical protein